MEAVPKASEIEALLAESEWIGALAARLVGDAHSAEDLAQETRLAALRHRPQGGQSTRPWLATVARNGARWLRRSSGARADREAERARERADEFGVSPEELIANLESQERVSRLVRELPQELADVILLSFYEGMSSAEIAKLRGIPAGTVRWRKKQALDLLRERLDDQHGGDRSAWLAALTPIASPNWRQGAKAASGGAGTAGLLATWIAMSTASKAVTIALLLALCSLPLLGSREGGIAADHEALGLESVPGMQASEPVAVNGVAEVSSPVESSRVEPQAADPVERASEARPVTSVKLRVVDPAGNPVAKATVNPVFSWALSEANADVIDEINPLRLAALRASLKQTSGSDGLVRWETDLLREGGKLDFEALGPDYSVGSLTTVLEVGAAMDLGDLVLRPAGLVEGRVFMSDGSQPGRLFINLLRGAPPETVPERATGMQNFNSRNVETTTCSEDGSFRFSGVPGGEYFAYVDAHEGSPGAASEKFEVVPGQRREGIELQRVASALGPPRIEVYGADGKPLLTANLSLHGDHLSYSGSVNNKGHWTFSNGYEAFAGGRVEVRDDSLLHQAKVVDPLPLEPQTIRVQLLPAQVVERTLELRGSEDSPVTNYSVRIQTEDGTRSWDGQGENVALHLPSYPDAAFQLTVTSREFETLEVERLMTAGLPDPWVVQLEALPGIRGRVVHGGRPLSGASVKLLRKYTAEHVGVKGNRVSRVAGEPDETRTDKNGDFVLYPRDSGEYVVFASARRKTDQIEDLGLVTVENRVEGIELELREPGELRGTVRDHTGAVVAGAHLVLGHPFHDRLRKRSGRDGTFRFRKVPEGDWYLRVVQEFDDGFWNRRLEVPEGWEYPTNCRISTGETTLHDVVLPDPAGGFIGGLWNPKGLGSERMRAELTSGGWLRDGQDPFTESWEGSTELRVGEEFRIDAPLGREYSLSLSGEESGNLLRRTIQADELPLDITREFSFARLTLEPAGARAGQQATGELHVSWSEGPWAFDRNLKPDGEGRYGPLTVPAGKLRVTYEVRGEQDWRELDLEVGAGEQKVVGLP